MSVSWLIAGLGNFKGTYDNSPHNMGYAALDALARRSLADWREKSSYVLAKTDGASLIKPLCYMNVSGGPVKKALDDSYASIDRFLLVFDDISLPWGQLRFRRGGSAGGHNGVKSVIDVLGTQDFARLRLGVGPLPEGMDPADYVLKRMSPSKVDNLAQEAADALESFLKDGLDKAMTVYNQKKGEGEVGA